MPRSHNPCQPRHLGLPGHGYKTTSRFRRSGREWIELESRNIDRIVMIWHEPSPCPGHAGETLDLGQRLSCLALHHLHEPIHIRSPTPRRESTRASKCLRASWSTVVYWKCRPAVRLGAQVVKALARLQHGLGPPLPRDDGQRKGLQLSPAALLASLRAGGEAGTLPRLLLAGTVHPWWRARRLLIAYSTEVPSYCCAEMTDPPRRLWAECQMRTALVVTHEDAEPSIGHT